MAGCEYPDTVTWARELELCRHSVRYNVRDCVFKLLLIEALSNIAYMSG